MKKFMQRKKKGFTLVELMVVVAIIAALVLLAVPKLAGNSDKAKLKAFEGNYRTLTSDVTVALTQDYSGTGDDTLEKALEAIEAKAKKLNGPGDATYTVDKDNGGIVAEYTPKAGESKYKLTYTPADGETEVENAPEGASFKN